MAIKLARTREFDGKMLAAFKRERDRIDQLMAQSPSAAAMAAERPAIARRARPRKSTERDRERRRAAPRRIRAPREPRPGHASFAQLAERWRLTALRQFRAVAVEHEPMVAIARRRAGRASSCSSRWTEVAARRSRPAHDVAHALQRVVDDHRQMVARRQVAAAQDDVAPDRWLRRRARTGSRPRRIRVQKSGAGAAASARRMSRREAAFSPRARRARASSAGEPAAGSADRAARRPGRAGRSEARATSERLQKQG